MWIQVSPAALSSAGGGGVAGIPVATSRLRDRRMRGRLGIGTERILVGGAQEHARIVLRFGTVLASPVSSPLVEARWWETRRAQNLKPATYVCPFCDGLLHATIDHMLVVSEGVPSRRR